MHVTDNFKGHHLNDTADVLPQDAMATSAEWRSAGTVSQDLGSKQATVPCDAAAISTTPLPRSGPAPWLMPHQTGDRAAGMRQARAIAARRTPTGAPANFDLPKAP
jgi:hypothetical protein